MFPLQEVVKMTVFVADANSLSTVDSVLRQHLTDEHPARSVLLVSGLPRGGLVAIDAVAAVGTRTAGSVLQCH
jgi:2-iminobutanoate/2-iminopropanoate deaminase